MKSIFHYTTYLIDLCVVNLKNYWGAHMFTQEQAPKTEGFVSCVRDTAAWRKGWPLCFSRTQGKMGCKRTGLYPSFCQTVLSYSSYDWNKILKLAMSGCISFFCEVDGSNICLSHSCFIKFNGVWEANHKKKKWPCTCERRNTPFEEPRTCIAKEDLIL